MKRTIFLLASAIAAISSCNEAGNSKTPATDTAQTNTAAKDDKYLQQPLVSNIYTADPSAHVFNGRIYVYPSHDTATGTPENDNGDHFNMMDYHILSLD